MMLFYIINKLFQFINIFKTSSYTHKKDCDHCQYKQILHERNNEDIRENNPFKLDSSLPLQSTVEIFSCMK